MSIVIANGLAKTFDAQSGTITVLRDVNFSVSRGEFVGIFGPNGCGKSTLLNIIAGLEFPDRSGSLRLDIDRRQVATVFQDYRRSLLPWRSTGENVEFPLLIDGLARSQRRNLVADLMHEFGVTLDLDQETAKLSGGQAQTVCMLRALVRRPELLLLDEPFSALDYEARVRLQLRLMSYAERHGLTVIIVSHDIDESLFLSDRTLLLSKRPASVQQQIRIDLPRPRRLTDQTSPQFNAAKSAAIEAFTAVTNL